MLRSGHQYKQRIAHDRFDGNNRSVELAITARMCLRRQLLNHLNLVTCLLVAGAALPVLRIGLHAVDRIAFQHRRYDRARRID